MRKLRTILWAYGVLGLLVNAGLAVAAEPIRILALGDSLTAGYNLPHEAAFPVKLEAHLKAKGYNVTIANGGVSGDTSAGGLARLGWILADTPQVAIVELGANDGLRGLDPEQTFNNLDALITQLKEKKVKVLLAGMLAPPNLGKDYSEAFNGVFPRLAKKHKIKLYPFFLDGIITDQKYLQPDGMHPNIEGVDVIVGRIAPYVTVLLEALP